MTRKQKKQDKKLRKQVKKQSKIAKEIELMARNYGKAISRFPRRPHDQDKFIEDGRIGCLVSSGSKPKVWCDECPKSGWCEKEIKWRIVNEVLEARWSA